MKKSLLLAAGIFVATAAPGNTAAPPAAHTAAPPAAHTVAPPAAPTADAVLAELKAGNQRHAKHQYTHPHVSAARQKELVAGQHPHAVILACADSRVAPEIVFDQGLGDLFTIRVAGNVAPDAEVASMEYAVEHLHTPLIVVMGHQSCGAVGAAIDGGEAPGHLPALVNAIAPAVEKARTLPGNLSDNAVRINVEMVVDQLRASQPLLAKEVADGNLRIVGAVYSLETGAVTWLPEKTPQ